MTRQARKLSVIGGRFFASEAAAPSAVIILKKIDMDRIEIVNKYCGGGTLPKVITEPSFYLCMLESEQV